MEKKIKKFPPYLYFVIIVMAAWIISTEIMGALPTIILPSPSDMYEAFVRMSDSLLLATFATVRLTITGFLIGCTVGIFVGLAMAYSRVVMDTIGPITDFLRPIPVYALIPLFMVWFGLGALPGIILIAFGVAMVLCITTYEAIRNMPSIFVNAAANLGASKFVMFRTVIVPYIVPHLIGAVRVAAATSWGLDVAAEFMGVQVGLGHSMIIAQSYLNMAGLLVLVLIYSVLAIVVDQLTAILEKRLTRWTERSTLSFEKVK